MMRLRRAALAVVAGCAAVALDARRRRAQAPAAVASDGDASPPAGLEIERKFLVKEPPADLDDYAHEEVAQGYLAIDGEVELRLRHRGADGRVLTVKGGRGEARTEVEFELDEPRFAALWPLTAGRRLRKVRYGIPVDDGRLVELDIYRGWLQGLLTAEVEFPSRQASAAFVPPSWFGEEVTDDRNYSNRELAVRETRVRAERSFRLRTNESPGDGVRRVALGQIDEVIDRLEGRSEEDLATAVHESRKSLKRLRAVARLARDGIGKDAFGTEDVCFRDAGRALSGRRDSEVLIEALDALAERYPLESRVVRLGTFRSQLVAARDAMSAHMSDGAPAFSDIEAALRGARERVAAWPLRSSGFGALAPGLERIYRDGRRAYRDALVQPTGEHVHEWRKRAKDLSYSLQLLEAAAPRRMKSLAHNAHELSELLGDGHDLVILEQELDARQFAEAEAEPAAVLRGLCERRRAELELKAFGLGSGLYRKPPSTFVRRIERGWRRNARA